MVTNTYVVSVYSHFTNELESEVVFGNSMYEAFKNCSLTRHWVEDMPVPTSGNDTRDLNNLKQYMFDNDHAVNMIRID